MEIVTNTNISSEEKMVHAIELVNSDYSYLRASEMTGIPPSTIRYRLLHENVIQGHLFTEREEEEIILEIQKKQKGDPMTKLDVIEHANKIIKESHPSQNISVSDWWFRKFKAKHKNLTIKKSIPRSSERVLAENKHICKEFIEDLKQLIQREGITPDRIHNIDESPFFWDLSLKKIITDKNIKKHFQEMKNGDHITILSCITASGRSMKPLIIFKGKSVQVMNNNNFYVTSSING